MSVIELVDLYPACLGEDVSFPDSKFYAAVKTVGSLLLVKVTDVSILKSLYKRLLSSSFVPLEEYSSLNSNDEILGRKIIAKHSVIFTKTSEAVEVFEFSLEGNLVQRHRVLALPE